MNKKTRDMICDGVGEVVAQAKKAFDLAHRFLLKESNEFKEAANNLSVIYFDVEQYDEAVLILRELVDNVHMDMLAPKDKMAYSSHLNNLGVAYHRLEKFELAVKYMVKSWEIKIKMPGQFDSLSGIAEDIVDCYLQLANYEKAEYYLTQLTNIAFAEFGSKSDEYQIALSNQIGFLEKLGREIEADILHEKANEVYKKEEKLSGETYERMVAQTKEAYLQENFSLANELHTQVLENTVLIPDPSVAWSIRGESFDPLLSFSSDLDAKGYELQKKGKLADAAKYFRVIIEIVKTSLGEKNMRVALAVNNLAEVRKEQKDFEETKQLYIQCLSILNSPLNRTIKQRSQILDNIASFFQGQSFSYAPSIDSAEQILKELEKRHASEDRTFAPRIQFLVPQPDEPFSATVIREMKTRIIFYESIGNFDIALRLREDKAELTKIVYAEDETNIMTELAELAGAYLEMGKFLEAEHTYTDLLNIVKENGHEYSMMSVATLQSVAIFYGEIGDYEQCRHLLEQAIQIYQSLAGTDNERLMELKKNLLIALKKSGKQDLVQNLTKELVDEINTKELTEPLDIQEAANYYLDLQRFEEAEELYLRAMDLIKTNKGEWNLNYGLCMSNLASAYRLQTKFIAALLLYEKALQIRKADLGEKHPKVRDTMIRAVLCYAALDKKEQALAMLKEIEAIDDYSIKLIFAITSETQKLTYLQTIAGNTDVHLSVILNFFQDDPKTLEECFNLIQKRKSLTYESKRQQRKLIHIGESDNQIYRELSDLKKTMASYLFSGNNLNDDVIQATFKNAENRMRELEKQLSRSNPSPQHSVISMKELAEAIPLNSLVIEIFKFKHFHFKANLSVGEPEGVDQYLALVISPEQSPSIKLFNLGAAKAIDHSIARIRNSIAEHSSFEEDIVNLSVSIVEPIAHLMEGREHLIYCIDGNFSILPFDLLRFRGKPLLEIFTISFTEKVRDLLRDKKYCKLTTPVIVAYPDYYYSPNGFDKFESDANLFQPLEATAYEGRMVAEKVKGDLYMGKEATKQVLEQVKSPALLHIASHSFYGKFSFAEQSPLLRSGIALAGANICAPVNVGILTADEIALLNLEETELVVLSACQTALGEQFDREGTFGLQRAVKIAGAQRVIVSLWKIPDEITSELMAHFYEQLYDGVEVAKALTAAKLNIKVTNPDPINWASFVLFGAPDKMKLE